MTTVMMVITNPGSIFFQSFLFAVFIVFTLTFNWICHLDRFVQDAASSIPYFKPFF